jgi:hypothetical protein
MFKIKIMKNILKGIFVCIAFCMVSCESIVEGINDDPNGLVIEEVDADLFLTGAQLANALAQAGHANRMAGMWSGQLVGYASVYGNAYGYNISTAEANSTWNRIYISTIPQMRHIVRISEADVLLSGIAKVMEAHAIGTAASIFGDVPYSEINQEEIDDPAFDGQVSVIDAAISLLDDAISDLNGTPGRSLSQDIYYGGDSGKWIEAANTLKGRYHMYKRDYSAAYAAALQGISSSNNTMSYKPLNSQTGDQNLFYTILDGSRAGDIGSVGSYLSQILADSTDVYRGNAKTIEIARGAYYTIDENTASNNMGIIEAGEPHQLVSFEENHLMLAEAGARTAGFDTGLQHLNEFRAWLNSGGRLNANFSDMEYLYEDYDASDFADGGMENADGIADDRALLREIIEERYVSGFGQFMPFDDARRLRKSDTDVLVPFPLNVATASAHPERYPYADGELNANSNAPGEDPGIFSKTAVNQ